MDKYFIYCRKSTESEDRQVLSIESQINEMKALASRLGVSDVEVFTESRTAKEPGRPIFNDMMKRVYRGEARAVLSWKLDRLARNPIDGASVIWALRQNGVSIITPSQTYSHNDDNIILMYIEFGMAQKYVEDLSKNVKRGNKAKLEKGGWPNLAPLGYLNYIDPLTKERTITIDEKRFPIIRRMWDLMLMDDYSVMKIVEIANNEWGLRTRQMRRQGGNPISFSFGYTMFTNPFYCGIMERVEGRFPHTYPKMVTADEFNRVQEILHRTSKPKPKVREFSFTGMMKCDECGCSITAEEKSKITKIEKRVHHYTYYRCTKKRREAHCSQPCMPLALLEVQIDDMLLQPSITRHLMEVTRKAVAYVREKYSATGQTVLEDFQGKLADTQKSLDVLTGMRIRELISDEEFKKERIRLQGEYKENSDKMEKQKSAERRWDESVTTIFDFSHQSRMWFKRGNRNTKRKILNYIGSNWTIRGKKLYGTLHKPFVLIENTLNTLEAISSQNPRLEPGEYGSTESPFVGSEIEFTTWCAQ